MLSGSKKRNNNQNIYNNIISTLRLPINMSYIGNNLKQTLEQIIISNYANKCMVEGYVKGNSIKVLSYSSGKVDSNNIIFEVVFECQICNPVEGMIIDCSVKNITKAGIKAEIDETPTPLIIFLARDHHTTTEIFNSVEINNKIKVRVIGQRFELNDEYVSIVAELVEIQNNKKMSGKSMKIKPKKAPKLVLVKEIDNEKELT